jgi:hypothetical protein
VDFRAKPKHGIPLFIFGFNREKLSEISVTKARCCGPDRLKPSARFFLTHTDNDL